MKRKIVVLTALAASVAVASPAMAWGSWGGSSGGRSSGGYSSNGGGSHQVPEPGTLGLMAASLIGLGLARRRKRKG